MKKIYLDHAATTPIRPEVEKSMEPYFDKVFGNPSSLHSFGREAKIAVDDAREKVAGVFGRRSQEIIFTSGGTESCNLALFGIARAHKDKGKHIIISKIEHHAVLHAAMELESEGFEITYLDVDKDGLVDPKALAKAIRKDTILVSVMYANNEIGTIEPIAEIGKEILKKRREYKHIYPFFHTDACQATGYLDLNVDRLHVDLMTINGSKMYGPKGAGVLYLSKGTNLKPMLYGGGQEFSYRSGTENLPGIVGLAEALLLAQKEKMKESARVKKLRDKLIKGIEKNIPDVKLNGHAEKRLPNNVNMTITDIEGEAMLLYLDELGIAASTGSACTSTTLDPSHVLLALGLPYEDAHGSLRLTLGKENTEKDVDYLLKVLPDIVEKLRRISPIKSRGKRKLAQIKKGY